MSEIEKCSLPAHFEKPFKYVASVGTIFDAKNRTVLDVRGWGYLTGKGGGLGIAEEAASIIQDQFGEWTANAMNNFKTNP